MTQRGGGGEHLFSPAAAFSHARLAYYTTKTRHVPCLLNAPRTRQDWWKAEWPLLYRGLSQSTQTILRREERGALPECSQLAMAAKTTRRGRRRGRNRLRLDQLREKDDLLAC